MSAGFCLGETILGPCYSTNHAENVYYASTAASDKERFHDGFCVIDDAYYESENLGEVKYSEGLARSVRPRKLTLTFQRS